MLRWAQASLTPRVLFPTRVRILAYTTRTYAAAGAVSTERLESFLDPCATE